MLMEMIEITIQINSLASSATKSQVDDVVLSAIIIAANLIILPLVIILGPRCIQASSASSNHVRVAAVMVVEVLFDKLYVGVGVLYRYDTLTQRNMVLTDSIAVHLALLLPALMTALDVQDALVLAEQMEVTAATDSEDNIDSRSSSFARVASKVDTVSHSPVVLMIGKCGLVSSIFIGVILATYSVVVSTTAHAECERRIGKIASCAAEKYYFTDGFFQKTDCAFAQVTSFKCHPGKGNVYRCGDGEYTSFILTCFFLFQDNAVAALPDVVDEYALMTNLLLINISNSKTLDRAPLGWAYVPNEQLTIDLHGAVSFSELPFQLCTANTNLTKLDVRGTVAETTMNWNGQLSAANLSSFDTNALNGACVVALKGLTSLSLADNNLSSRWVCSEWVFVFTAVRIEFDLLKNTQPNSHVSLPCLISLFSQIDDVLMMKFDSLINLDLRRNNISALHISMGKYCNSSLSSVLVRVRVHQHFLNFISFFAFMT